MECSRNARLLFIGLWNFCDDKGRHPLRAKQIKAEVFPADDLSPNDILGMLQELSENDLISTYTVDSQEYLQVIGWHHQRIDKPQPAKYPEPIPEHSKNDPGTIPPDRIGKDWRGLERIGEDKGAPNGDPPKKAKAKRGTRLPDNFPTDDELTWSTENFPGIDHNLESAKFRDYWNGIPGQKGVKLDWPGTWRNWIRKAAEYKGKVNGRKPPMADDYSNKRYEGTPDDELPAALR